ncbi:hypothetical protein [Lyngbya aestuarii]|uniref:hypothetical protein n=1 Tax=Lyngbya aestuarii TaxID=118322 RepID=UPI00403E35DE
MTSQHIQYEDCDQALNQIQGELLEALLQPEEDFYPWNPAEPETEAYFSEIERGFLRENWQAEQETTSASQAFFKQLHKCWQPSASSGSDTLKRALSERFASSVPQAWIEAIANQAQQVFLSKSSLDNFAQQLVRCVEELLPNWAEEDLQVIARPIAYQMRNLQDEVRDEALKPVDWSSLSEIEHIRWSLTVACSALVQLREELDY